MLSRVFADLELVGDEYCESLTAHPFSRIKVAESLEPSGSQPGLFGEFLPGKCFRVRVLPPRQGTLWKLP